MGCHMARVHLGGGVPRIFYTQLMKKLSIFIDESGDFGEYKFHSPYYIMSLVMHKQNAQ